MIVTIVQNGYQQMFVPQNYEKNTSASMLYLINGLRFLRNSHLKTMSWRPAGTCVPPVAAICPTAKK
jgi:hypothetical protein